MMHAVRSRQLPTNHNLARLVFGRVIREYQDDSPSMKVFLPGLELSRDGPWDEEEGRQTANGLTGLDHIRVSSLANYPPRCWDALRGLLLPPRTA